jgi:hypothetical protein
METKERDEKGHFTGKTDWINLINNAPKWVWDGIKFVSEGEGREIKADNFPTLGEFVVGVVPGIAQNRVIHVTQPPARELKVLEINYQCTYPADASGFGSMDEKPGNLNGIPIRIFIGTKYTGILLQYNHSDKSWYACFSHGNYGKKHASGGNWSSILPNDHLTKQQEGQDCRTAIMLRKAGSEAHKYTKGEVLKEEKYMLSNDFWAAVDSDLRTLGLIE